MIFKAMFDSQKAIKKNVKENNFLIFDFTMKNAKVFPIPIVASTPFFFYNKDKWIMLYLAILFVIGLM